MLILNRLNIKKFFPYLILGLLLWFFTHESGIHATIAGVLLAAVIPHRKNEHDFSLLIRLEHGISPYVAYFIMPLFAFANAGVSLQGLSLNSLLAPVPLGILLGLFVGKQIGVFVFSFASIKLGLATLPTKSNWISFYAVGILTGIGFTMSLFVGNLAFVENMEYMDGVKIGVLSGSLLSTVVGYVLLWIGSRKKVDVQKFNILILSITIMFFSNNGNAKYDKTFFDFNIKSIEGNEIYLKDFKNSVILLVNTASYCGFTKQYDGLQEIYQKYKDKGLIVIGVPSNSFNQEKMMRVK